MITFHELVATGMASRSLAAGTAILKDRRRNEWTAKLPPGQWIPDNTNDRECAGRVRRSPDSYRSEGRIMVTATDRTGNSVSLVAA